jgi:hypothetical protein
VLRCPAGASGQRGAAILRPSLSQSSLWLRLTFCAGSRPMAERCCAFQNGNRKPWGMSTAIIDRSYSLFADSGDENFPPVRGAAMFE